MTPSILSAELLGKSYSRREVVRGVSFEVKSGEVVALLGPNGAGKTTCFRMAVGMLRPDQGRILLDGQDVTNLPMHRRCRYKSECSRRLGRFPASRRSA